MVKRFRNVVKGLLVFVWCVLLDFVVGFMLDDGCIRVIFFIGGW